MANIGITFSEVLDTDRALKTAVPLDKEPILVQDASGKTLGMCFGDGLTSLKDLPLIGVPDKATASSSAFTTTITCGNTIAHYYQPHTQAAALNFTLATSGNVAGGSARAKIVADGLNAWNFTPAFTELVGITSGSIPAAGTYFAFFNYDSFGGCSVNVVLISGGGTDTTAPTAPQGVAVSNVEDTTATVTWTASTDA